MQSGATQTDKVVKASVPVQVAMAYAAAYTQTAAGVSPTKNVAQTQTDGIKKLNVLSSDIDSEHVYLNLDDQSSTGIEPRTP